VPVEYIPWGDILSDYQENVLQEQVKQVLDACNLAPSFELVEVRTIAKPFSQIIIVDACDGSFGPRNEVGIRRKERLALTYRPSSKFPWEVRALRLDFPSTMHQNHVLAGEPRSLCLYAEQWCAVERTWTAERFLVRILWWLREAAEGRLHHADQPIEQLFFSSRWKVVLPSDHEKMAHDASKQLHLSMVSGDGTSSAVLRAHFVDQSKGLHQGVVNCSSVLLTVPSLGNGPVEVFPRSLGSLHDLLASRGSSLIDPLIKELKAIVPAGGISGLDDKEKPSTLIIVYIPRTRNEGVEEFDVHGFVVSASLGVLGERCGALFKAPGQENVWYQDISIGNQQQDSFWRSLTVDPVDVRIALDKSKALELSGVGINNADIKGVLAGVGALGSSLANIWAREGWGDWDYIDKDIIEPHNITRHICSDNAIGYSKAEAVKFLCDELYPSETSCTSKALVHGVNDDNPSVHDVFIGKDILVDATTMLDVPRDLGVRNDVPRVASLFLTPSGKASVMLLESATRALRCSALESQYYRALLVNDVLGGAHLEGYSTGLWVGGGCRDVSAAISIELIQMHGAILARQLRLSLGNPSARICVWNMDDNSGAIDAVEIEPSLSRRASVAGWIVEWDEEFLSRLQNLRFRSLPNETGGVLLGVIDQKLKTISLVVEVGPPTDSVSTTASYSRGTEGLLEVLQESQRRTANVVNYVGEWHSHPLGISARPSTQDREQMRFLKEAMSVDGMPVLMLIVSENSLGVFVEDESIEVSI